MERDAFIVYANRTDITADELPEWFRTVCDCLCHRGNTLEAIQ